MRDKLENFVLEHLDAFNQKEPNVKLWSLIEEQLNVLSDATDPLEQFIGSNKDDFNDQLPNAEIWSKIDQRLSAPPKIRKFNFIRLAGIAASLVFLMLASAAVGIYFYNNENTNVATVEPVEHTNDIPSEFVALEKFYQKQVNRKHTQLASYKYDSTVNEDLSQLDEILKELRVELRDAPKGSEEQIIHAMKQNYETKIKILEIVLNKIKTTDQKDDENEGISM